MDGREFFDEAIAAGRAALDRQGKDGDVPVDDLIAAVYALDMLADQLRALDDQQRGLGTPHPYCTDQKPGDSRVFYWG